MRKLEGQGRLDRELENLPSDGELAERRKAGRGLTRPEAAVLLAYAKMTLYEDLLRTELPDRAYLAEDLAKYFPRPLRRRYAEPIAQHRLKREIVATWIANSVVNRGLDVFVSELEDETGGSLEDVLLAYVTARDAFGLPRSGGRSRRCRPACPATLQTRLLRRGTRRAAARHALVRDPGRPAVRMRDTVARFRPGIETVMGTWTRVDRATPRGWRWTPRGRVAAGVERRSGPHGRRPAPPPAACDIVRMAAARRAGRRRRRSSTRRGPTSRWTTRSTCPGSGLHPGAPRRDRWDRLALTGLEDDLSWRPARPDPGGAGCRCGWQ